MEDSNFRQWYQLMNVLFKVRNRARTLRDVKNGDRPGYVLENTGREDKKADNQTAFLAENAQIVRIPGDFLPGNARIAHKSTRTRTGQRLFRAPRTGRQVGRSRKMPPPYLSAFRRSADL